jgi:hypothetical protein
LLAGTSLKGIHGVCREGDVAGMDEVCGTCMEEISVRVGYIWTVYGVCVELSVYLVQI